MALPRISDESSWQEEIADGMRETYSATISIHEPGARGKYDPKLDTRAGAGPATSVITNRPASVRAAGWPADQSGAYEWGPKRRYRIQFDIEPGDPLITSGMTVVVSDGGADSSIERLTFQVVASNGSSHAATRIVYAVTDFGGSE